MDLSAESAKEKPKKGKRKAQGIQEHEPFGISTKLIVNTHQETTPCNVSEAIEFQLLQDLKDDLTKFGYECIAETSGTKNLFESAEIQNLHRRVSSQVLCSFGPVSVASCQHHLGIVKNWAFASKSLSFVSQAAGSTTHKIVSTFQEDKALERGTDTAIHVVQRNAYVGGSLQSICHVDLAIGTLGSTSLPMFSLYELIPKLEKIFALRPASHSKKSAKAQSQSMSRGSESESVWLVTSFDGSSTKASTEHIPWSFFARQLRLREVAQGQRVFLMGLPFSNDSTRKLGRKILAPFMDPQTIVQLVGNAVGVLDELKKLFEMRSSRRMRKSVEVNQADAQAECFLESLELSFAAKNLGKLRFCRATSFESERVLSFIDAGERRKLFGVPVGKNFLKQASQRTQGITEGQLIFIESFKESTQKILCAALCFESDTFESMIFRGPLCQKLKESSFLKKMVVSFSKYSQAFSPRKKPNFDLKPLLKVTALPRALTDLKMRCLDLKFLNFSEELTAAESEWVFAKLLEGMRANRMLEHWHAVSFVLPDQTSFFTSSRQLMRLGLPFWPAFRSRFKVHRIVADGTTMQDMSSWYQNFPGLSLPIP